MDAQGPWRVASLSPSRREGFLTFFDHERGRAFADNPAWAGCYCHYFHAAPALDWASLGADANRAAMAARIEVGEMEGYLAYDDAGSVVGWLNAQPRHKLPHCFARFELAPTPIDVPAHEAAVVTCFVVDPASRRRGVARTLLTHALGSLGNRGIRVVDAFPAATAASNAAAHCGPLRLYEALGFARLDARGDRIAMRKTLR